MAEWIESKYASLLSNRFDRYTNKNGSINFRCPYCGDSTKDKTKARGYLLSKNQAYYYYCHNCHISRSFSKFLEEQDQSLHREFIMELMKEKASTSISMGNTTPVDKFTSAKPVFKKMIGRKPFKELKKVSQLQHTHRAKRYILSRLIPSNLHYKIFYVENGYNWAKQWVPDKFPGAEFNGKDPRIVLPLCDSTGKCVGAVARSIDPNSKLRYLKLNWDSGSTGFIYGLEALDQDKRVYVFEGQFDSMFIPNSVAVGSLHWQLIKNHIDAKDVTIVLDNEPRNKTTKESVDSAISKGYNVCIWPCTVEEKDVNDMVIAGYQPSLIKEMIDKNTFSGLKARLAFSVWAR